VIGRTIVDFRVTNAKVRVVRSTSAVVAIAISVMLIALTGVNGATGNRRALIIANAEYRHTVPLKNPLNDAALIGSKLREAGFDVQFKKDLSAKEFSEVLNEFSSGLDKESEVLFYYAGHGFQFNGENFLVAIDAALKSEASLQFETFRLNTIINVLEHKARVRLIFWDACRDNPLAEAYTWWVTSETVRSGAAPVHPRRGDTYIVYSAEPNKPAQDGDGKFSPFAESLGKYIAVPGLEINDMLENVRKDVRDRTHNVQAPEPLSKLERSFYFRPEPKSDDRDTAVARIIEAIPPLPLKILPKIRYIPPPPRQQHNWDLINPVLPAAKRVKLAQATFPSAIPAESAHRDKIAFAVEREAATIIRKLRISPNGRLLALGDEEGILRIIRLADFTVIKTIRAHTERISDLDFTPDSRTLLSAGQDGALRFWNPYSGAPVREPLTHPGSVPFSVRINPNFPRYVLMGDGKGWLIAWDLKRKSNRPFMQGEFHHDKHPVRSVAYQPGGKGTYLSAGGDGVINVRLADDRRFSVPAHDKTIFHAGYSASGKLVYTAGNDRYVKIWESARLEQKKPRLAPLAGHFKYVLTADMSQDERLLVTGGGDKALNLWNVNAGQLIGRMQAHTSDVEAAAFSPDGKFVVSTSEDKTVRIWSVSSREHIATLFFQKRGEKYAGLTFENKAFGDQNSGLFSVFVDGRKIAASEISRFVPYGGQGISISEE
jgi:WD40 repeat protein